MLSSELVRKILLFVAALLMPVEVWAALPATAVDIRLASEVKVAGEAVVLGDVATIFAKSMKDFQALSTLVVSQLPAGGDLKLPSSYLEARIREALPAGTKFTLHAPAQIVFRAQALGVGEAELAKLVTERGRAEGKIPAWAEARVEVENGADQLKLISASDLKLEGPVGSAVWRGPVSFKVSGGTQPVWLRTRIRWFADVWVAARAIPARAEIGPADFKTASVELTNVREEAMPAATSLDTVLRSARARRSLRAETPLVAAMIERTPDARAGQALKVVFISESGIRVATEGALMGAGVVGEEVKARLRSSRKVVTGRLTESGALEVSL